MSDKTRKKEWRDLNGVSLERVSYPEGSYYFVNGANIDREIGAALWEAATSTSDTSDGWREETPQKMAAIQAERRAMIQDEAIKAFTHCPTCGGDLDTGWECTQCQADWEVVVAAIKGEAAPASPCREDLVEALAAYAHEAWSGWMRYLFKKCLEDSTGRAYEIPLWAVRRWQRQMTTAYADLPEDEKESDRVEARKMLAIMEQAASPCRESGEGDAARIVKDAIGFTHSEAWGQISDKARVVVLLDALRALDAQPPASDTESADTLTAGSDNRDVEQVDCPEGSADDLTAVYMTAYYAGKHGENTTYEQMRASIATEARQEMVERIKELGYHGRGTEVAIDGDTLDALAASPEEVA